MPKVWCLVQGNPFGVLFQKSADNIGASFEHKGFDSSVIQVPLPPHSAQHHTTFHLEHNLAILQARCSQIEQQNGDIRCFSQLPYTSASVLGKSPCVRRLSAWSVLCAADSGRGRGSLCQGASSAGQCIVHAIRACPAWGCLISHIRNLPWPPKLLVP